MCVRERDREREGEIERERKIERDKRGERESVRGRECEAVSDKLLIYIDVVAVITIIVVTVIGL